MKFFGEILCEDDGCYLNVVLRHAGAFGNKVVRNGKRVLSPEKHRGQARSL